METNLRSLLETLDEHKERYFIFPISDKYKLLVTEDRGRIYGPFEDDDDSGLAWIPQVLGTPDQYAAFLQDCQWNVGGDRLWIAPEFPFFTKEREKFNETYTVQDGIDPGHYRLVQNANGKLTLRAELKARLFEHEHKHKHFLAERTLQVVSNPLRSARHFKEWMEDVDYCGFRQDISITDVSPLSPMDLEIWNLFQVRAGGKFLLPYLGDEMDYVDYYAPSDNHVLFRHKGYAEISVSSCAEHKIGIRAYQSFGRIGYLRQQENGKWCLLIRNYFNEPTDKYIKEPSDHPGETGCSLFVYMNDTRGDGFAELETVGQTFCAPEKAHSELQLDYWFFTGGLSSLKTIAKQILGIVPEV